MSDVPNDPPADEEETTVTAGAEWHSYLMPLNLRSSDGREFEEAGTHYRPLPLPLQFADRNTGHDEALVGAQMQTIEKVQTAAGPLLYATGIYARNAEGTISEAGAQLRDLVASQTLRWVSIDGEAFEWEEWAELDGVRVEDFDDVDDEDWFNIKWVTNFTSFAVMGATVLAFPAFPQAVIAPIDQELAVVTEAAIAAAGALDASLVACGYEGLPPRSAFDNPNLEQLTPMTVTDDGRIFGHVAGWGVAHIGFPGKQIYAPKSACNYAQYRTKATQLEDGTSIATGIISLGTGHADLALDHHAAAAHYDNTGSAVAHVATGEDEFGIWIAGTVDSDATPEQVRKLRGSVLSGDWRRVGADLEMVACLAVNVGGFPIPQPTLGMVASAHGPSQNSLVAAGVVSHRTTLAGLAAAHRRLERTVAPLVREQAKETMKRLRGE